jgi:hypothetical protein
MTCIPNNNGCELYHHFNIVNSSCFCPWSNAFAVYCPVCPGACLTCTLSSECLACPAYYILQAGVCLRCPSAIDISCSCPEGFFYQSGKCVTCAYECATCDQPVNCLTCVSGYSLWRMRCITCPAQ